MDTLDFWMPFGMAVATALAACCFSGLFEHELRDIFQAVFVVPLRVVLLSEDFLGTFWQNVRSFYRSQFADKGRLNLQTVLSQCIGAALYLLFFLGFTFSDFHLLALSLVAVGIDTGHFETPMGAGTLTALSVIASILFWGSVLSDLMGVTNTAPWKEALSDKWKKYLFYIAILCLALSLAVTTSMGLYRGKVLVDEGTRSPAVYSLPSDVGLTDSSLRLSAGTNIEPQAHEEEGLFYWIPILANVCIPILVLIGGVFSSWGLVMVIKIVLLLTGFVLVSPLGVLLLGSTIARNIVERVYELLDAVLRLLAAVGRWFLGLFGWKRPNTPPPGGGGPGGVSEDIPPDVEPDQEPAPRPTGNPPSGSGPEGDSEGKASTCASGQDEKPDEPVKPSSNGWNPFDN